MRFSRYAGALLVGVAGCTGGMPVIARAVADNEPQILRQCRSIFPRGPWQATHVIEASMPLGNETSLIGVVAAARKPSVFQSALVTQEGIVLFDAIYRNGPVEVRRAVPPVDPNGFGRAMINDVRLMLFEPRGAVTEVGQLPTGESACRWRDGTETVDVIVSAGRVVQLRRFDGGSLAREVKVGAMDERGLPSEVWLETTGMIGYSLHLKLLDFTPGEAETRVSAP